MKQGKSLEILVAHLEKALAGNDNVTITAPKKVRDRITNRLREHDVVIAIRQGHHEYQIAIECRDLSRPITVNQVEGFWKKCQDTGVQGIIVSTKGFCKPARTKATHLGIRCFDLEQAKSFNWLGASGMEMVKRNITNIHWTLIPIADSGNIPKDITLVNENGVEITKAFLIENAKQQLAKLPIDSSSDSKQTARINFIVNNLSIFDRSTKGYIPLKSIIADIEYEVIREHVPFDLFKYSEKNDDREIANAALATHEFDGIRGKFMFIRNEDQSISLSFIAEVDKL